MTTIALSEWVQTLESGARPKGGIKDGLGEVPSLGAEHLSDNGGFNFAKVKRIPSEFFETLKKGRVSRNDILIVKDGATTGKVSFVNDEFPFREAAINEHVFRLTVDPRKADPRFVFRYLQSPQGQMEIMKDFRGATVGGIGRNFIEKVVVPDVDRSEQERIASILDKADSIRSKRESLNALIDEMLRATFLDTFGDPRKALSSELTLTDVAHIARGRFSPRPRNDPRFYGGDYPFIQTGEIANSDGYMSNFRQTLNDEGIKVSKSFPAGSVFIAIVGATIGATAVSTKEFWCPDSVIGIVPKKTDYPAEFLEYLLRFWRPVFVDRAPETARANINLQTLKPVPIPICKNGEARHFGDLYRKLHDLKENLNRLDNDLLASLSQRAFRGEL